MFTRKKFRILSILLLLLIQILFLLAIFWENRSSSLILIFITLICALIFYSYWRSPIHHNKHEYEPIKVGFGVPLGALFSYILNQKIGLGPVLAASLTGFIASFLPLINKKSSYLQQLQAAVYCGAFVGMSSARVANGFLFIIVASVFTTVLLIVSKSLLNGVGGKLGTLAFLGVAITYLILYLLNK